jgi:NitT/TauT family transport system substrate-binding protein
MSKKLWIGFGILAAVIAGIILLTDYFAPTRTAQYAVSIIDPLEANNLHIPVAQEKGFFTKHGINATVTGTSAGKLAMDALNGRSVDYAVVVDMNIAQTLFEHDDLAILAELAEPIRAIKILGRRDRGVNKGSDLVGKKIGVLYGVNIHLFLLRYLEEEGISPDKVKLVNLRPPDAVAAFEKGDIDAIISWQPHIYRLMQSLQDKIVVLTDNDDAYWKYRMLLVTRKSRLDTHHDEAERVLRAVIEADDFIRQQPTSAYQILAQRINLDSTAILSFIDEIQFRVQLTQDLVRVLETDVAWLQSTFQQGRKPISSDMGKLIAPELQRLRPEAWRLTIQQ